MAGYQPKNPCVKKWVKHADWPSVGHATLVGGLRNAAYALAARDPLTNHDGIEVSTQVRSTLTWRPCESHWPTSILIGGILIFGRQLVLSDLV